MSESDTTAVFFNIRISFGLIASSASDGIDLDTSERRMKCHTWHQEQEDDMCRSKRKHRVPYCTTAKYLGTTANIRHGRPRSTLH